MYVGHKIGRSSSVPGLGKNDTELTLITDRAPELRLDVMGKKGPRGKADGCCGRGKTRTGVNGCPSYRARRAVPRFKLTEAHTAVHSFCYLPTFAG